MKILKSRLSILLAFGALGSIAGVLSNVNSAQAAAFIPAGSSLNLGIPTGAGFELFADAIRFIEPNGRTTPVVPFDPADPGNPLATDGNITVGLSTPPFSDPPPLTVGTANDLVLPNPVTNGVPVDVTAFAGPDGVVLFDQFSVDTNFGPGIDTTNLAFHLTSFTRQNETETSASFTIDGFFRSGNFLDTKIEPANITFQRNDPDTGVTNQDLNLLSSITDAECNPGGVFNPTTTDCVTVVTSWSATLTTAEVQVPEPSTVLGLGFLVTLGVGTFANKKSRKNQA